MSKKNLTALALILLLVAPVAADGGKHSSGRETDRPRDESAPGRTAVEVTLDDLSHHVDLWHEAVLKGDEGKVRHYEREIRWILGSDIEQAERAVRYYAEKATLAGLEQDEDQPVERAKTTGRCAFRRSRALLSAKRQLARSFARVDAFSNKYRLVNDYIDLLRKQLDMPRPQLASEKTVRRGYPDSKATE